MSWEPVSETPVYETIYMSVCGYNTDRLKHYQKMGMSSQKCILQFKKVFCNSMSRYVRLLQ